MTPRVSVKSFLATALAMTILALLLGSVPVFAHCDSIDGPIASDVTIALESGDVTPVLKWIPVGDESNIIRLFAQTRDVRELSDVAREVADSYFLETVVRIHRAGEGAPYTGLKPAGTQEPIIMKSDSAIANASLESLEKELLEFVSHGMAERFEAVSKAREHADESVGAGREFVERYVIFMHYVERLYRNATTNPGHGGDEQSTHTVEGDHGE